MLHNHRALFEARWKIHSNSIVSLIRNVYRFTPCSCLCLCSCVLVFLCFHVSMDPCGLMQITNLIVNDSKLYDYCLKVT